jgi:hypothetical protein
MRVSSLSDDRVVRLVSTYFVPAWVSRDFYQLGEPGRAEREAVDRVDRTKLARGLVGGSVCVYLLAPDGSTLATLPVQQAWTPAKLVAFLEKFVADHKARPRDPEAVKASAAKPRGIARTKGNDSALVNVWVRNARAEEREGNRGLSHDRVELAADEWKTLLPPASARAGAAYEVPAAVADALFRYCYPPGPHWKVRETKMLRRSLSGTVVSARPGEVVVRLEGSLELIHPYEQKPTDGRVTARLVGYLRGDPAKPALTGLTLASEEAEFVWHWEGKALPRKMEIAFELEP